MKILVTGANGFVGRYLIEALHKRGDVVVGMDIGAEAVNPVDNYYVCNLMDFECVKETFGREMPDVIIHLAAVSSVAQSWERPSVCFMNNTSIFLNVMEAVRELRLSPRILSIGSSEEYGNVEPDEMPLKETHSLNPCSPYAVARVSQEMLSRLYAEGYKLDVIMTRSFNQFGPGQRSNFAIPSFVKQLVEGKRVGNDPVEVKVGDLSIVRDFLDVRDAVSAYVAIMEKGLSGEVYNVCSGTGRTLESVLERIAEIANVKLSICVDQSRVRPADNRVIIGDNSKIKSATGWHPVYDLDKTIRDIMTNYEIKHL